MTEWLSATHIEFEFNNIATPILFIQAKPTKTNDPRKSQARAITEKVLKVVDDMKVSSQEKGMKQSFRVLSSFS
jgi:microcystin degradation protein MlrC